MLWTLRTVRLVTVRPMTMPPSFPTLPGLGWSVHKKPVFSTLVASHVSGREVRDALYQNPIWQFELTFDALSSSPTSYPGAGANSLQALMGFFLQMQGQFGTFLYNDPTDSAATNVDFRHWRWGDYDLHLLPLYGRVPRAGWLGDKRRERFFEQRQSAVRLVAVRRLTPSCFGRARRRRVDCRNLYVRLRMPVRFRRPGFRGVHVEPMAGRQHQIQISEDVVTIRGSRLWLLRHLWKSIYVRCRTFRQCCGGSTCRVDVAARREAQSAKSSGRYALQRIGAQLTLPDAWPLEGALMISPRAPCLLAGSPRRILLTAASGNSSGHETDHHAVINLINAARAAPDAPIAFAECFTFITTTGTQYTWTNVDYDISFNGSVFLANGPLVSGLKYKGSVGLEVDKQQITIAARPTDVINGAPFLIALRDGALTAPRSIGTASSLLGLLELSIGGVRLFQGRISTVDNVGRTQAT